MKKTLIAIPAMDQCSSLFAASLATLKGKDDAVVSMELSSLIYDARNHFASNAVSGDFDYVMWFDSDMTFPPDTLQRMIKHMEDGKDIVSGLYFRRRPPYSPVLFKRLSEEVLENGKKFEDYDDYPKDSLFKVDGFGFGCVMLKVDMLIDMGLECSQGWFTPFGGFGEDLSFCIRAKQLGYELWCDSSIKCGHVSQFIVDEGTWERTRDK